MPPASIKSPKVRKDRWTAKLNKLDISLRHGDMADDAVDESAVKMMLTDSLIRRRSSWKARQCGVVVVQ